MLREVVKHSSVEEAVLCDIDEAVIRLSKKYLPTMSVGFKHPVAQVHVGDGFEFLKERKGAFDVIITDSSDPEGPAESLFQKPYFELINGALREGGVMTTQGCTHLSFFFSDFAFFCYTFPQTILGLVPAHMSYIFVYPNADPFFLISTAENQWLHLSLIQSLKKSCSEVFPVAEYAYTTIPTYPSGQIGFMVCCKDKDRNVKDPVRWWNEEEEEKLCRYYSRDIHRASYVLPNFAKKALR